MTLSGSTQSFTDCSVTGDVITKSGHDFAAGHGVVIYGSGAAWSLGTPAAPTAVVTNGASTTRVYTVLGTTGNGDLSPVSAGLSVTTAPATLSATAYVTIMPPVLSGVHCWYVYADGVFVGTVSPTGTFRHDGLQSFQLPEFMPTTPGTLGKAQRRTVLSTTSTTITLDSAVTNNGTYLVVHDDTIALQDAAAANDTLELPHGTYRLVTFDSTDPVWQNTNAEHSLIKFDRDWQTIRLAGSAKIEHHPCWINKGVGAANKPAYSYSVFGFGKASNQASNVRGCSLLGGRYECFPHGGLDKCADSYNYTFLWFAHGTDITHDYTVVYFPHGGVDSGETLADGSKVSRNRYRFRVLDYGGGEHDNWAYIQGGTDCTGLIQSSQYRQSHGLYFGQDRPDIRIHDMKFSGIGAVTLKYAFNLRGSDATPGAVPSRLTLSDVTVKDSYCLLGYPSVDGYSHVTAQLRLINSTLQVYSVKGLKLDLDADSSSLVQLLGVSNSQVVGLIDCVIELKKQGTTRCEAMTFDVAGGPSGKLSITDVYGCSVRWVATVGSGAAPVDLIAATAENVVINGCVIQRNATATRAGGIRVINGKRVVIAGNILVNVYTGSAQSTGIDVTDCTDGPRIEGNEVYIGGLGAKDAYLVTGTASDVAYGNRLNAVGSIGVDAGVLVASFSSGIDSVAETPAEGTTAEERWGSLADIRAILEGIS